MKRGTYVLIIFLIFFVLIIATIVSFMYFEFAKPAKVRPNTYLEINLSGTVEERPMPDIMTTFFMGGDPLSMHDLWLNFQKAKVDKNIKGIVLRRAEPARRPVPGTSNIVSFTQKVIDLPPGVVESHDELRSQCVLDAEDQFGRHRRLEVLVDGVEVAGRVLLIVAGAE